MTVQELIRELEKLDPTLEVYVEGYEDGYTDISTNKMQHIEVCRDFYNDREGGKDWWNGDHEDYNAIRKGPVDPFKYDIKKGIVFGR